MQYAAHRVFLFLLNQFVNRVSPRALCGLRRWDGSGECAQTPHTGKDPTKKQEGGKLSEGSFASAVVWRGMLLE